MHQANRNRKRSSGFTLIEVITTIAVMILVMPPIVQGFQMAARMAIVSRQRSEAIALGQSRMDELMAEQPWITSVGNMGPEDVTPGVTTFHWQALLSEPQQAIDEEVTDMEELTVTVSWTQDQIPEQIVLTTEVYVPETTIQTTGGMP